MYDVSHNIAKQEQHLADGLRLYSNILITIIFTLPRTQDMHVVYDVSHNIAKQEQHLVDGRPRRLLVHRKVRIFPFILSFLRGGDTCIPCALKARTTASCASETCGRDRFRLNSSAFCGPGACMTSYSVSEAHIWM